MMQEYYLNENEIYYRKNNFQPDRPTLVFAHGVSGSSSAWLPYEKIFENKYNILTFDIRGHGKSKKFPNYSDYEIKNFADDLHKLVSYLDISKFILISNSFGGLIALEYLKSHREAVLANIFTSPEIYLYERLGIKIIQPIIKALTGIMGFLPFNSKPRGHVDYTKHINSTDWNLKRNLADIRNTTFRVHLYILRKSLEPRQEYSLEKINAPTLIIHGEKDSMIPIKSAIKFSKKIKNSELIVMPNIDHNTVHNAVNKMSEIMESFIEKNKGNMLS